MNGNSTGSPDSPVCERKGAFGVESRTQVVAVLSGLLVVGCMMCWLQWRTLASMKDSYTTALLQLDQMRRNAGEIKALRQTPRTAVSRTRANEELLAQVEQSLSSAGIDRAKWHDSIPQPAVRLSRSDYKKLTTRLYFEAMNLNQLAAFVYHLQEGDPTLQISSVNLGNTRKDSLDYDVDLGISYLVYAPQEVHNILNAASLNE